MWSILSAYVHWNGIKFKKKKKIFPFINEESQFRIHNSILKFKVGCIDKQFFNHYFKLSMAVGYSLTNDHTVNIYIQVTLCRVMVH